MLLQIACQNLGWPSYEDVLRPKAAGPRHYADRVAQKIREALTRMASGLEVVTGILCADANSDTSESPIAVVCHFSRFVTDDVLREAQRLCWNFSRTALLITLEPHRLQAWTCSKKPSKGRKTDDFRILPPLKNFGRFQAQLVRSSEQQAVICSVNFLTIHQFADGDGWLRSACLAFRSRLSAYFLSLTSRLASDRAAALSGDILDVSIPQPSPGLMEDVIDLSKVDSLVEEAFNLNASDTALIEDMLTFVYREGGKDREGRKPTVRLCEGEVGDLHRYADFFLRTLRATFGKNKAVRATLFEEDQPNKKLPLRMIATQREKDLPPGGDSF
jgi:hypothetical protein